MLAEAEAEVGGEGVGEGVPPAAPPLLTVGAALLEKESVRVASALRAALREAVGEGCAVAEAELLGAAGAEGRADTLGQGEGEVLRVEVGVGAEGEAVGAAPETEGSSGEAVARREVRGVAVEVMVTRALRVCAGVALAEGGGEAVTAAGVAVPAAAEALPSAEAEAGAERGALGELRGEALGVALPPPPPEALLPGV